MRSRLVATAICAATSLAVMLGGCLASQPEPTLTPQPRSRRLHGRRRGRNSRHRPHARRRRYRRLGIDTEMMEAKYWTATIADGTVMKFAPADFSGRAASLPLLVGVARGETTACGDLYRRSEPRNRDLRGDGQRRLSAAPNCARDPILTRPRAAPSANCASWGRCVVAPGRSSQIPLRPAWVAARASMSYSSPT